MMIVIGAIVGFFILIMVIALVAEKNAIPGTCPKCSSGVRFRRGVGACRKCGEPLRHADGRYIPTEPGYVPEHNLFIVTMAQLRHPREWKPVWSDRCCVCGKKSVRRTPLKVKVVAGHAGPLLTPTNIMDSEKLDLGYCDTCRDGVRYSAPPGFAKAIRDDECLMAFQSPDFLRDFIKANGR